MPGLSPGAARPGDPAELRRRLRSRWIAALCCGVAVVGIWAAGAGAQASCGSAGACPAPGPASSPGPDAPAPAPQPSATEPGLPAVTPPAPTTSPAPAGASGGSHGGILGSIFGAVTDPAGTIVRGVGDYLSGLATSVIQPVFDYFARSLFHTPDLGANASLRPLWFVSLAVVDAGVGLVIVIGALKLTWGGLRESLEAKEIFERLAVGAVGAHMSLLVFGPLSAFSNALARAFIGVHPVDAKPQLLGMLATTTSGAGGSFSVLLVLAVAVAGILVIFWDVVRIITLALLVAAGPFGNFSYALSETEGFAKGWWRAVIYLSLVPVAQALLYSVGLWLFLFSPTPVLSFGGSGLVEAMVLFVVLYLIAKVPVLAFRAAAAPVHQAYANSKRAVRTVVLVAAFGRLPGFAGALTRLAGGRRAAAGVKAAP